MSRTSKSPSLRGWKKIGQTSAFGAGYAAVSDEIGSWESEQSTHQPCPRAANASRRHASQTGRKHFGHVLLKRRFTTSFEHDAHTDFWLEGPGCRARRSDPPVRRRRAEFRR